MILVRYKNKRNHCFNVIIHLFFIVIRARTRLGPRSSKSHQKKAPGVGCGRQESGVPHRCGHHGWGGKSEPRGARARSRRCRVGCMRRGWRSEPGRAMDSCREGGEGSLGAGVYALGLGREIEAGLLEGCEVARMEEVSGPCTRVERG